MSPEHRQRRRPRPSEPESIGGLMQKVLSRLGGEDRSRERKAFDGWQQAAGEMLRRRCQPESLRGTTLVVRASSSAIAHQIVLLKAEILTKMAETIGPDLVKDLRTRVGPLTQQP